MDEVARDAAERDPASGCRRGVASAARPPPPAGASPPVRAGIRLRPARAPRPGRGGPATGRRPGRPPRGRPSRNRRRSSVKMLTISRRRPPLDFSLSEEQQLLKKTVREFAESELAPHAREWDEKQEFPREVFTKLGELGLMGVVWPAEYGGSGHVHPRLRDRDGGAVARRRRGRALRRRPQQPLLGPHLPRRHRGAEEEVPGPARARARRSAAGGSPRTAPAPTPAARKTTAVRDGDALGAERLQDLHHQRPRGRHRGRDGGDGPQQGQEGHLGLRRRARARRASAPARRRTSSACAPPTPPSWSSRTAASRPRTCSARKATASSTRCGSSTAAASASRPSRSASRRPASRPR